jgi:hypothetical protein
MYQLNTYMQIVYTVEDTHAMYKLEYRNADKRD